MTRRNPPREEAQVLIEALEAGPYYDLPYIQKWMARVGLAENDDEVRKLLKELERFMNILTTDEALAEEARQEPSVEDINQALLMGTLGIGQSGRAVSATEPSRTAPARRQHQPRRRTGILPGSVIHGTLRPEDLIPAFFRELELWSPAAAGGFQADVATYERAIEEGEQPEDDTELVVSLQDALDAVAPPGLRFGAHEGDGSDFGWWPVENEDEEEGEVDVPAVMGENDEDINLGHPFVNGLFTELLTDAQMRFPWRPSFTINDITTTLKTDLIADCRNFIRDNREDLADFVTLYHGPNITVRDAKLVAGGRFWDIRQRSLTRFATEVDAVVSRRLTESARSYPRLKLLLNDDGGLDAEEADEGSPAALVTPTAESEAFERAFDPELFVDASIEVKGSRREGEDAAATHNIIIDAVEGPLGQNTRFRAHGREVDLISWHAEGPREAPFPPGNLIFYRVIGRYVPDPNSTRSRTPEFVAFATGNDFARSYVNTALWASTDESDESGGHPLDEHYGPDNIDLETLREMLADCARFQEENAEDLRESGLGGEKAGHDFWLTRNMHGAGFWDEGLGPVGDRLTEAARAFGEYHLYVGDDGKIHGERE